MKHLIPLLLLALLLPATAIGHDFEVDGIYYNINGTTATVTRSPSSNKYSGDVTIPATVIHNGTTYPVTSIDDQAFELCTGLSNINIPNSVTSIGEMAFCVCSELTNINIPNSVTSIGFGAFSSCVGLISITVDDNNPKYDSRDNCNAIIETSSNTLLTGCINTVIPNSVTSIGDVAFFCIGLTNISIPNSVTSIGDAAFDSCLELVSVDLGNSVASIGHGAFRYCNRLVNIDIPNSVSSIGSEAFMDCGSIARISIPDSVVSIGSYAFYGCTGLISVTIPNLTTSIEYGAFSGCSGLSSIIVDNNNPIYDSRDNCNAIIESSSNTLISGCMNTVIPNSVTSIGESAFYYCTGLTNINIPNSVTSIGNRAFESSGLTNINIPNSVTSIGYWAFQGCDGLDTVYSYISDPSLVSIGSRAFERYTNNYTTRILYVPYGTSGAYQAIYNWSHYFGNIIEMEPEPDEHNYLTINDITARRGETVVIPVAMTNEASITSFQTDIFLPEGIELLQEDGEYLIDPSSRMTRTHSIISEASSNGAIHVLCYSPSNKAFTGNSGEDLFYMTVKVADDAEGDYTIALRNTRLTTTESEELLTPDAEANVKVKANEPGDVKEDGMINVADVSALIQFLLTGDSSLINLDNADVNGDGLVIINDIAALINMLLAPGK